MGEAGDSYSAANSPYSPCLSSLRLLALLLLSEVGCDISWLAAVPTGVRRSECCPSIGQSLTPCFEKQTRVVLRSNLSPCFCVVHLVPRRGLGGGGDQCYPSVRLWHAACPLWVGKRREETGRPPCSPVVCLGTEVIPEDEAGRD